ncbi:MAG: hypothetical protein QNJ36_02130 [Calothrix sp. MO_167.B42]|nr:hypothetical protein [Calothrix sp. MO_167.B42]
MKTAVSRLVLKIIVIVRQKTLGQEAEGKRVKEYSADLTSTNKVYGDTPNYLPLQELEKRKEIPRIKITTGTV